jgi:trehalose 6-phosphate phosphatase
LSREASHKLEASRIPGPLPPGLIAERLARGHLLLCLDFDGTISELTNDPWKAVPLPRAKAAIAELVRYRDRLTLAIVSGRDLDTLLGLLGLRDGLLFAGTHGLEFIGRDGVRRYHPAVKAAEQDIERLRKFLARTIPSDRGLIMEDKRVAITLNYRNATPDHAREALAIFDEFVNRSPTLQLLNGKMVHEAIPRGTDGKGDALNSLMRDVAVTGTHAVYFGDDNTDENAFHALVPQGGIGVLVGAERASFAQYRVDAPSNVADVLEDLAAKLRTE